MLQLYKIRGANNFNINLKSCTINVGISLGNKWFTTENTIGLIRWVLENSSKEVVLNVVDSIHAINIEVTERIAKEGALRKATEAGAAFLSAVKLKIDREFSESDKQRIVYTTWKDVLTPEYKNKVDFLYAFYESNADFKDMIHGMVRNYISRKEIQYSEDEVHKLGSYIIEELPEITCRVPIAGIVCDAYVYPFDGEVTRMVEKIQGGEIFPEIRKKILDTEPKIFIEVR